VGNATEIFYNDDVTKPMVYFIAQLIIIMLLLPYFFHPKCQTISYKNKCARATKPGAMGKS
jgi:hypothetical protein